VCGLHCAQGDEHGSLDLASKPRLAGFLILASKPTVAVS
jgi:hypothetical protein